MNTPYNPKIHQRRSIRLQGYDYSQAGAYFVTICAHKKECLFGKIVNDAVQLNEWGKMIVTCWEAIPEHFPNVELDAFVVMPNHVHGIMMIQGGRGEAFAEVARWKTPDRSANASPLRPGTQANSLGAIVQNFKSVSTRKINQLRGTAGLTIWQRNYYEHIIRGENELNRIRQYISDNPLHWVLDKENPAR